MRKWEMKPDMLSWSNIIITTTVGSELHKSKRPLNGSKVGVVYPFTAI